jgi:hypothetical protein
LYSGQGCAYHYSAVRVQELVFFISDNGVYKLDSFQLVNVGEAIWDFIRPLLVGKSTVQGMVDERSKLVYWNIGSITVVYNYDKDTWATCSFNYATALKTVPGTLYSSDNIDDVNLNIDTVDIIIDAGVNSAVITQSAYLAFGSQVYAFGSGSVISHTATVVLPATYVDSVWIEKEISEVKLLIKKVGAPVINLLISGQDGSSGSTLIAGPFPMDTSANFVNEAVFKVRNISVGKLVTLTFIATNTATDYVESWSGASVRFVDTDADK